MQRPTDEKGNDSGDGHPKKISSAIPSLFRSPFTSTRQHFVIPSVESDNNVQTGNKKQWQNQHGRI